MILFKATKRPSVESLEVIRRRFNSSRLQKIILLLIFTVIIDFPLSPSEFYTNYDWMLEIVSASKQKRRIQEVSKLLMIKHKVPEQYHYFFDNWDYDYDPLILAKIIEVESGWNENAIGAENFDGSRDYGMAQLNSLYHDYFRNTYWHRGEKFNVMNGHHSLYIAAEQLQMLYTRLGNEDDMIRAYNIGIGSVINGKRVLSGNNYLEKVKNVWVNEV